MPKAITIEQRQQMVKLAQDHYSGPEIARKMGCSTTTVYMILNQYADEHHIPRQSLRVQEHRPHVLDDPINKTWPLGSHQNIAPSNNTSPEEKVPEASVEDTAVTTVEEIPTEEIPEVGVEDTAVTTVEESPKEEAPEAGVEDTAVTTVEESPKEEAPEASVEDTVATKLEREFMEKIKRIKEIISKLEENLKTNA